MSKIFSIKTTIITFSCIGSILVILSTLNFGVGLSPDSVEYLAAADNLLLGRGFLSYNGLPITEWPPLYPILLSLCSFSLNVSTTVSAIVLNAVLFGLIIYSSGMILTKYINSKLIIVIGLLALLFSLPVLTQTLWARSELLFIFLILLYINSLLFYVKKGNLKSFIMLVIITAFAILNRYIGVVFILTTIIIVLLYLNESQKKKIISIFVYSALSVIPISVWLIRNYMISGTFFGERGESRYSFWFNIYITVEKILSWDIPDHFINLKIFFIIFILITIVFLWLFLTKKISYKKLLFTTDKRILIILGLFTSVYISFLILISTFKAHNPIDSRLLSPVYIPIIILLSLILQAFYNLIHSFKYSKLLSIIFFSFIVLGSVEPIYSTITIIDYHYNYGEGYSGSSWQKNIKKKWLMDMKKNYIKNSAIYSNEPFEVYYLISNYAKWSPRKTFYDSDEIYVHLIDLNGTWPPEKKAYLVWFMQIEFIREPLFTPAELASISEIKMLDSSDVGKLYSIEIKNE